MHHLKTKSVNWQKSSPNWISCLFPVMHSHIEVPNNTVEEKFKFQVRNQREPLLKRSLFAKTAKVRPIVEDQDGAVREAMGQVT